MGYVAPWLQGRFDFLLSERREHLLMQFYGELEPIAQFFEQSGFLYVLAPMKCETNAMESSLNEETDDGGSLLNQANAGPFIVIAKALHRTGS